VAELRTKLVKVEDRATTDVEVVRNLMKSGLASEEAARKKSLEELQSNLKKKLQTAGGFKQDALDDVYDGIRASIKLDETSRSERFEGVTSICTSTLPA